MSYSHAIKIEEKTQRFGENIIEFCQGVREDFITSHILKRLIESATNIGAYYTQTHAVMGNHDLKKSFFSCKREAQETKYWLSMYQKAVPEHAYGDEDQLQRECQELISIFDTIVANF